MGEARILDLAGEWRCQLDPEDRGEAEGWALRAFEQAIRLPGSLQEQGFGDEISVETPWMGSIIDRSWFTEPEYEPYRRPGQVKVPFWLQPERYYVGPAWYQREVEIPPAWRGRRLVLTLERPHWETRVWWDDREVGRCDSLSTPHVYDLGTGVEPGRHRLTVRVDNRMIVDVGVNAHSVSDHTQTNWNGLVGGLTLTATDPVWVEDVQVYPDVVRRAARVQVRLGNATGQAGQARLSLAAQSFNGPRPHQAPPLAAEVALGPTGGEVTLAYDLGPEALLWDEFQPALYRLSVEVEATVAGARYAHGRQVTFGLREFRPAGTQFAINGRPTFLRGTVECCVFPLTGYPPTDVEAWRRLLRIARAHGLNHLRFHSWCPPEAAFVAADELGFYYQVECAAWARIGEGKPIDRWLYEEGERIVRAYGNHPSFVMMAYGNEPHGPHQPYLAQWVRHWREADPRRVHTSGAGWPALPENEYHNIPKPRIQAWGAGLTSRINARPPETCTDYREDVQASPVPIVSHEIGQWCAYPNFGEIPKYTGVLKARNFEIFRDSLERHHMGDQARDFLVASGKLQVLCYKEEIESALRTPGFGGFQLLQLNDFPGQGTALVGVLDAFWESKGYVTPEAFRRFCDSTVVLARLAKRYWTTGETLEAALEVAHFGPAPLAEAVPVWRLEDQDGRAVASGRLPAVAVPLGNGIPLGTVRVPLAGLAAARRYRLVAGLAGTPHENDWDVWVFPEQLETPLPGDVLLTRELDEAALARLAAGGKVLWALPPERVRTDVALGFSSVFWNTAWTRGQAPHTLGILCDPRHPVFAEFPTDGHSDWQWWELLHGAAAMVLDELPPALRPLVQPIDTWFRNRRLGLLLEARVGGGRLMVCSMDLWREPQARLVARQLRHSLYRYLAGPHFDPRVEVPVEAIRALAQ